jgi:hypothetical protein
MKRYRFEIGLGSVLLCAFVAVCLWQDPGLLQGRLSQDEINRYLDAIDRQLPLPADAKPRLLSRLRTWAEADDGRPVYMLNLMRYYPQLLVYPGFPKDGPTSPRQANAVYERHVAPLLLARGGYPTLAGTVQGKESGRVRTGAR